MKALTIFLPALLLNLLGTQEISMALPKGLPRFHQMRFEKMDPLPYGDPSTSDSIGLQSESPFAYCIQSRKGLQAIGIIDSLPLQVRVGDSMRLVDFHRQEIWILSLGTQGTTGHEIILKEISVKEDSLDIQIHHEYPVGPVGEALTQPTAFYLTEKHPGEIPSDKWGIRINGKVVQCICRLLE